MSDRQNSELERKLQGRTLKVYLYLQRKKDPSGIREIQRDLCLSSPSVADYQIEKLVEMGLACRDSYGRAYVTKNVKVKALDSYVNVGNFTVPRLAFYASTFTGIAVLYALLSADSFSLYGLTIPIAAAGIFWFEALRMWNPKLTERLPSRKQECDNSDFWASLVPGLGALAVFVAAAYFLFYYVGSSEFVPSTLPIDPVRQLPAETDASSMNELAQNSQKVGSGSHSDLVANFPPNVIAGLVVASALVAGFLGYLLVKLRTNSGVLSVEHG